jgi:preprotein translocase subunit SecE
VADREKPTERSRDATELNDGSVESGNDVFDPTLPSINGRAEDEGSDGEGNGDVGRLISVGAPRRRSTSIATGSTTPVKAGRESKGRATPSRRGGPAKRERTGPIRFVRESVGELRKVVYPTGQQVLQYFLVVLVFVLFVIAYVSLLDLGLGTAIFKIFS